MILLCVRCMGRFSVLAAYVFASDWFLWKFFDLMSSDPAFWAHVRCDAKTALQLTITRKKKIISFRAPVLLHAHYDYYWNMIMLKHAVHPMRIYCWYSHKTCRKLFVFDLWRKQLIWKWKTNAKKYPPNCKSIEHQTLRQLNQQLNHGLHSCMRILYCSLKNSYAWAEPTYSQRV